MNEEPDTKLPKRELKWFRLTLKYFIISAAVFWILAVGLGLSPMIYRSGGHSPFGSTISNAKHIGLALFEFDNEYDFFPNDSSTSLVTTEFPDHGHNLSGKSSNTTFLQLMATGITLSEGMFYAKIKGSIKPDGIIIPSEALKKGEVGFSYISGLSSKDDPTTPLVLTPLIPGTTKFDPKPFKGKAVILHINNEVGTYTIHDDGHVYDKGIDILSPKHPVWNGKAPDIRYPE